MSNDISSDQIEIILEFVQESRDMIDQLEPIIIELGQSCQPGNCWEILGCQQTDCLRHGHSPDFPCWLDMGYIGDGKQTCPHANSEQECKNCPVFQRINGNVDTINAIFRLFHSMKGSAGFLDLTNLSGMAHAAESLLDLVRAGKIMMDSSHVELLCQSCDFAKEALDLVEREYTDQGLEAVAEDMKSRLIQATDLAQERIRLGAVAAAAEPAPAPEAGPATAPNKKIAADSSFELEITSEMVERFAQEADELLQSAEQGLLQWTEEKPSAEVVASLFRNIHSFKGNCGFFGYADLERLSHQMESVLDLVKSGKALADGNPAEILLDCLDSLRAAVADVTNGGTGTIATLAAQQRQLDTLMTPPAAPDVPTAEASPAPTPETAPAPPEPPPAAAPAPTPPSPAKAEPKPAPAPAAPKTPPPPPKAPAASSTPTAPAKPAAANKSAAAQRQDIRVDLEKLDQLINLIGEMVIAENMLIHNPDIAGLELENFHKAGQQMSKLVRELQEIAMTIRMIPVSGLFRRMIRLVHDLSLKAGKKVELILSGEETEVDKTVVETITDPLVHLIRNSLDHGLEPPDERIRAGKPEKGIVRLSARHEEGEVWITIEDDGRGLNRDKILSKAISKGLIDGDGSDMSDKAIYNLIFQAGFSTADKITDVSGRGVGMDVVKQNIEKIKGKIEVTSKPGQGSRMILRIPLTLGIIDGMMVRVGDTKCIVPTLAIREAFRPQESAITITPDGQELARVRENFFPVIRLHEVLKKEPESHTLPDGILILLEYQDKGVCLFVDEIVGQQQTVIKGLSDYIGNVRWVSGCTILGDGEVCLILDVGHLVDMFEGKETLGI
ncbi:chemotaxis protein CheA [Trichloromonas acetexigens]|uniref:Chemotaxis protein CheA n=1 Tax=Trichloromonas acetexigens TaxID=38815 RepID=A0A550JIN7_9BACT|nr:chemotaxis protein CheA [Desulfuromonas acetexigens]TRO83068.1 chemotaxis protein CheA [Desulfuromonas acetexigens]